MEAFADEKLPVACKKYETLLEMEKVHYISIFSFSHNDFRIPT